MFLYSLYNHCTHLCRNHRNHFYIHLCKHHGMTPSTNVHNGQNISPHIQSCNRRSHTRIQTYNSLVDVLTLLQ